MNFIKKCLIGFSVICLLTGIHGCAQTKKTKVVGVEEVKKEEFKVVKFIAKVSVDQSEMVSQTIPVVVPLDFLDVEKDDKVVVKVHEMGLYAFTISHEKGNIDCGFAVAGKCSGGVVVVALYIKDSSKDETSRYYVYKDTIPMRVTQEQILEVINSLASLKSCLKNGDKIL